MFSMSNADELRQRAEQQQKQQKPDPKDDAEVERPNEEKNRWGQKKEKSTGVVEEKKPAPSNGTDSAAAEVVETAGASFGQEGGEEEMLMTEEQVDTFFQETIAKLTSLEEREKIKANVTVEVRIPALLIKIQHAQLESMGIDKNRGQAALNQFSRTTATQSKEAHGKMEEFTFACQRTYIEVLREMEPEHAETEAKMTPAQIMEFFEACDTLMALPETKKALRDEFLETEAPPDQTIVGYQRRMLRTLGFDSDHGVACLNSFAQDHPDDGKLQHRLHQFMRCASMGREEAVLGKEEMTKRMKKQQMKAMKEHKMAMELQALSLEGREEFAAKVFELNKKHALAVLTLTTQEEKAAYIDGIPQEEQWEMAKLRMLAQATQGGGEGGHSHSHAHGQPCAGLDHNGHAHGKPNAAGADVGSHHATSHSHFHGHGGQCSHDHNHGHSSK